MNRTVLLIDDDTNVLHGLARVLRNQPYKLFTARSGEEAMNILKAWSVDVIVSDETMPGMSGTDLLKWVSENCPEVMRILLTGNATTETAIRSINEANVFHFFTKPCNEVELALAIRRAIEEKERRQKENETTDDPVLS
ncbi:MAG: response regulator [Planctomycetia bacterium]|jgi:DNA-binding NtrC family response regulator